MKFWIDLLSFLIGIATFILVAVCVHKDNEWLRNAGFFPDCDGDGTEEQV